MTGFRFDRDTMLDLGCGTQIADDACANGYEPRYIGDNGLSGDNRLTLWDCNGNLAISTNGDTVWQDADPDGFAALRSKIVA